MMYYFHNLTELGRMFQLFTENIIGNIQRKAELRHKAFRYKAL